MDTVEELNSTYFYAGRSNLTASQLLFMIFCENTANQLGVQDFGAIVSIVAGLNVLPTRTKPRGAKHLLNPFRKNDIPQAPEFTIGMLIASARAGRWLYDRFTLGGCFPFSIIMERIMYIMLNAPEQLKDMLRRLDSCMSKNFWPISLIPSLP